MSQKANAKPTFDNAIWVGLKSHQLADARVSYTSTMGLSSFRRHILIFIDL